MVAGVCLLLVLAHGSATLLTAFTARAGLSAVPSALGVPFALPGLRTTPLGATDWARQLCENFAALLLVAVAAARMRRHLRVRPGGGRGGRLLAGWTALIAGWTALIAGAAAAGAWRGPVAARMVEAGALGWLPGAAALTARRPPHAARRATVIRSVRRWSWARPSRRARGRPGRERGGR
ncbi:hypothetical protein [Streptomyces sp. NPDC029674]|uniref:hypothetical protein n=1 Tax=Streptomyces sp. NPDC029674 TaxID=3365297 RepID=UPI00384E76D5